MQDAIIKGTGNSRYLKSVSDFLTQYPTYEDMVQALVAGTLPIDLNGINTAGFSQLGTALNKANLLHDTTATSLGLTTDATVADALGVLADVGNIHVWKRDTTETGVTDYPTSTDRNAYVDGYQDYQEPYWELSSANSTVYLSWGVSDTTIVNRIYFGDSVSVDSSGTISADFTDYVDVSYKNYTNANSLIGKFIKVLSFAEFGQEEGIYYIPEGSTPTIGNKSASSNRYYYSAFTTAQKVIGYPETGSAYLAYLGALGDKARIETGSYVGTGTYGADNPTTLTFSGKPKFVFIVVGITVQNNSSDIRFEWFSGIVYVYLTPASGQNCSVEEIENGISIANNNHAGYQMNESGKTYTWFAIIG